MKTIFWNVDTQYDFMRNDESFKGALPVPEARTIEKNLEKLTKFAKQKNYRVINTGDWHTPNAKEFSKNPDYKTTFPPHCLIRTKGAEFVPATNPKDPYTIDWIAKRLDEDKVKTARNIILYKDAFDVFDSLEGNKYTEEVLKTIDPDKVVVYGVATDVCVNYAVNGLLKEIDRVYVVKDAIKELPNSDLEDILDKWKKKGATLVTTKQVLEGKLK